MSSMWVKNLPAGCTERWDDPQIRHSCKHLRSHRGPCVCPCGAHKPSA